MKARLARSISALAATVLSACVVMAPPQVDQVYFQPAPKDKRVINKVRLKWLVRDDGYQYCSRITGVPITPTSRPMACAYWNVVRKECTIITPPTTGFNYVGHELRHCFEGAFHG